MTYIEELSQGSGFRRSFSVSYFRDSAFPLITDFASSHYSPITLFPGIWINLYYFRLSIRSYYTTPEKTSIFEDEERSSVFTVIDLGEKSFIHFEFKGLGIGVLSGNFY